MLLIALGKSFKKDEIKIVFIKRKKLENLRIEVVHLKCRIAELEEKFCPGGFHDWQPAGYDLLLNPILGAKRLYRYKCKKCGKTIKVSRLMDFKEGLGKNEQNQSKSWI